MNTPTNTELKPDITSDTWTYVVVWCEEEINRCLDMLMQNGVSHDDSQFLRGRISALRSLTEANETLPQFITLDYN